MRLSAQWITFSFAVIMQIVNYLINVFFENLIPKPRWKVDASVYKSYIKLWSSNDQS